ncbi:hypothetical protein CKN86_02155 [Carnobacterium divergens]|uniref:hypothetical protein n=1 Tax=Carnobacterium divergens TaxID=2748 RepID=UPI000D455D19|nr:hypothetical protein [Carnobacterium divergens]MCO6018283.1 hypothetical protein [Carnobacterium divergens]TFI64854.1 hypothetical protein CKN62_02155 [Carnobacterium divergens]TFI91728.1 hypothetical protein CKN84_02155 [Carnobacterium divergens]TFJ07059.1 hypothetical protein CKN86_02155 [Carnobacterium divergens]TFJ08284.1 hypothetical protein CKN65_02155 [Carnobacterium divergens]
MNIDQRLTTLENKIQQLELDNMLLTNLIAKAPPEWVIDSLDRARNSNLIPYPFVGINAQGSLDFYRIIDLLAKKEII